MPAFEKKGKRWQSTQHPFISVLTVNHSNLEPARGPLKNTGGAPMLQKCFMCKETVAIKDLNLMSFTYRYQMYVGKYVRSREKLWWCRWTRVVRWGTQGLGKETNKLCLWWRKIKCGVIIIMSDSGCVLIKADWTKFHLNQKSLRLWLDVRLSFQKALQSSYSSGPRKVLKVNQRFLKMKEFMSSGSWSNCELCRITNIVPPWRQKRSAAFE